MAAVTYVYVEGNIVATPIPSTLQALSFNLLNQLKLELKHHFVGTFGLVK